VAAGQAELEASRPRIFSIGHSTHELDELVRLLRAHGVEAVADVRRHPGSRRLPWFKREVLSRKLVREGLSYRHVPELGGRRRPDRDSPNAGWRVEGFRGYADHMAGPEFAAGLDALVELASRQTTVMMCAEGLWWRCHRRLIADALAVRHWQVVHIDPTGGTAPHELTSFAVADGERLTYPPAQAALAC
jgi:uncharacterized protein (DUF488 family)